MALSDLINCSYFNIVNLQEKVKFFFTIDVEVVHKSFMAFAINCSRTIN